MYSSQRLLKWLSIRPSRSELFQLTRKFFIFELCWTLAMGFLLSSLSSDLQMADILQSNKNAVDDGVENVYGSVISLYAISAFVEEVVFRFIPFTIVLLVAQFRPSVREIIVPALCLTAITFGLAHISNYTSVTYAVVIHSLVHQGVAGVVLATLFLKYTGLQVRYVWGALMFTSTYHFAWNGYIAAMFLAMQYVTGTRV